MAKAMLAESSNTERLVGILSDVWVCRESKMAAIGRKRKRNDITYISASIHVNNEIPTAIPMFSWDSNNVD